MVDTSSMISCGLAKSSVLLISFSGDSRVITSRIKKHIGGKNWQLWGW